jgi:hypothetical protein
MKLTKKFFCPVNGWDCPYWKEDGSCSMVDDGDNPVMKCYVAGCFWDDPEDAFVWEDEDGNRYDVQELLEMGYHFVNDEPIFDPALAPTMKIAAEILKSPPMGMQEIKIRNPNWEG